MKTSEFINQLERMGYKIRYSENLIHKRIFIDKGDVYGIGDVAINLRFIMDIYKHDLVTECLFNLMTEYARTPINDRDEPQKFHLKHKYLNLENNQNYLSLDAFGYYLSGDTGKKDSDVQTEFTQEEIDSLPFKIDSDTWDQDDVNKNDDVIVSKYYQDAKPNVKPKRKGYV